METGNWLKGKTELNICLYRQPRPVKKELEDVEFWVQNVKPKSPDKDHNTFVDLDLKIGSRGQPKYKEERNG